MENKTTEGPSDVVLVQLAKQGDFDAFQKLISKLQPRVYGLAFRILQRADDAEDVTQQTFLALIEQISEFREESSVATWVLTIATNHALKIIRKRKGLHMVAMSELEANEGYADVPHPEFIAPWSKTAEELAMESEVQQEIDEALSELDEKYRSVFVLRDVEGLSVRETAEALDLTESTVKVRLLRARLALRERLTRKFGDTDRAMMRDHHHS
jgi:RNA polymerase sigma-70 factor (ECF subfamily)